MGRMYFPGEKIRERLPKRESDGDIVGRFGAWLTQKSEHVYIGAWCIAMTFVVIRLLVWVYQCFQAGIFRGIFSVIGALFIAGICTYASIVVGIAACIVVLVLGWLCYNKWTLIVSLILASLWYTMLDGKMMVDQWISWLNEALPAAWEWYKNVL